jgi:hypothetical protein
MKKFLPIPILLILLSVGVLMMARPNLVTVGVSVPSQSVIIHETKIDKPLSQAMVEVLAKAPSIGVLVWDKDVLGPEKKPSAAAEPFLDAVTGKQLPQLTLQWPSGSVTSQPCPTTFAELRKAVGQ